MSSKPTKSARGVRPAPPDARPAPIAALHTGSGDPLLLLHGFMMSPHCWEQTAARLSSQCEVFAPALLGHWGAPDPEGPMDVRALADHVEAQLDDLGWRTCHIAGNSLGGWVGAELARRGRARTLTLIAPAGGWHTPSLAQYRIVAKFLALVPVLAVGRRMGDFGIKNALARGFALLWLSKNTSAVARLDTTAAMLAALNCRAVVSMLRGSLRAPEQPDFGGLVAPVRLMLCEYDRVLSNRVYARRYLKELPRTADRILVNNVGHVPMLEAPDRVATLITEHMYASRKRLRAV